MSHGSEEELAPQSKFEWRPEDVVILTSKEVESAPKEGEEPPAATEENGESSAQRS
jgi:hypothetical protein